MPLWFHSKNPETSWLSNLSTAGFVLRGLKWPSVEHFYQAMKYAGDPGLVERIRRADTPLRAMKAGRDRSLVVRADWEQVKVDLMREALLAKFGQNRKLATRLLDTDPEELIHESSGDGFWGRDRSGLGDNRLGVLLMEVRKAVKTMAH
jgi:ribA/ribD-fused uncharacterized protein